MTYCVAGTEVRQSYDAAVAVLASSSTPNLCSPTRQNANTRGHSLAPHPPAPDAVCLPMLPALCLCNPCLLLSMPVHRYPPCAAGDTLLPLPAVLPRPSTPIRCTAYAAICATSTLHHTSRSSLRSHPCLACPTCACCGPSDTASTSLATPRSLSRTASWRGQGSGVDVTRPGTNKACGTEVLQCSQLGDCSNGEGKRGNSRARRGAAQLGAVSLEGRTIHPSPSRGRPAWPASGAGCHPGDGRKCSCTAAAPLTAVIWW